MNIIAKTDGGFLIQASENEIKEILTAVSGKRPEKIEIGQKVPAIDYASTITKIKALSDSHYFKTLLDYNERFKKEVDLLINVVSDCKNIEV